jgi:HAD superfamily hydrolase (TIGR01509 family)
MTGAHPTAMPAAQAPGAGMAAVLFDMDGLLIDSEPLWFQVETSVMTRLGGQWSEADQQELLGSSLDNAVRYFLARAAVPADPAEVAEWVMGGIVDQVRERGVTVMPGAASLVAEVAASGLPYALVTSSQRRFVDAVLARTGLRFPAVVCGSDVTRGKPDPEPYLLAARRLGVPPARCLALEDSPAGVSAAEAAGCAVVAVPTLRPIEPGPDRLVLPSLRGVSLSRLRSAWAAIRLPGEVPGLRVDVQRRGLGNHAVQVVGDLRQLVHPIRLPHFRQLRLQVVLPLVQRLERGGGQRPADEVVVLAAGVPGGVRRRAAGEQRLAGWLIVGRERPAAAPVGEIPGAG